MEEYFSPLRVLIAEDSKAIAQPLIYYLKQRGHEVFYAQNGQQAIELFEENIPDIVLMDVIMPILDGIEATRQIKLKKTQHWIPLIMMTSLSSDESLIEGLEAGADDYMIKPINFEVLEARMRSMQRIAWIQQKLYSIFDNVIEGIITINHLGEIHSINNAAQNIFGYREEEIIGKTINNLIMNIDTEQTSIIEQLETFVQKTQKLLGIRKDLSIIPIQMGLSRMDVNNNFFFIALIRDITQQEKDRQRIEYLALHDPLTGLANRMHFKQDLERALSHRKTDRITSLLYLDIDGFKPINNTFGHAIGDKVLITLAHRIKDVMGKKGLVARLGGDEFVVLINDELPNKTFTFNCADNLIYNIGLPMEFTNDDSTKINCKVGVSIGIAFSPEHGLDSHNLLSASDGAMYVAKKAGKNQYYTAENT